MGRYRYLYNFMIRQRTANCQDIKYNLVSISLLAVLLKPVW